METGHTDQKGDQFNPDALEELCPIGAYKKNMPFEEMCTAVRLTTEFVWT